MEDESNIITIRCNDCDGYFDDIGNKEVYDCPFCGAELKSYKVKIVEEKW